MSRTSRRGWSVAARNDQTNAPQPEGTAPRESGDDAQPEALAFSGDDSLTFSRCAACLHAEQVDVSVGTLVCRKHDMCINAEAEEIPDDCVDFEQRLDG